MKAKRPDEPKVGVKPQPDGPRPTGIDLLSGVTPEEQTEPSPEEQDQYDRMATKAQQFIFSPKGSQQLLEQMNNKQGSIYDNVGKAAAMIGKLIKGSMDSAGVEASADALMNAGADYVVPMLFELGEAGGVFKFDSEEDEQEQMELAMLSAVEHFGNAEAQNGTLPQDEAQQYMRDKMAEEGGNFNEFMGNAQPPGQQSPMSMGVKAANAGGQPGDLLT